MNIASARIFAVSPSATRALRRPVGEQFFQKSLTFGAPVQELENGILRRLLQGQHFVADFPLLFGRQHLDLVHDGVCSRAYAETSTRRPCALQADEQQSSKRRAAFPPATANVWHFQPFPT